MEITKEYLERNNWEEVNNNHFKKGNIHVNFFNSTPFISYEVMSGTVVCIDKTVERLEELIKEQN